MPAATNASRSTPVGAPVPATGAAGVVDAVGSGGAGGGGGRVSSSPASSSPSSSMSGGGGGGGVASGSDGNPSNAGSYDSSGPRCPIGATVRCVVRFGAGSGNGGSANNFRSITYEGEVLAYDPRKVLVLKSASTSGRNSLNNVHMVNLSQPCEIQVLSEKREPLPDLPSLNTNRLNNKLRDQVERKRKQVMAFKVGVSPVGQKLFQAISKTIDEVVWNGENISVLKEVTIYPPYRPENVKGNTDSKALKHVRKIVEKHIADQQFQQHHNSVDASPHRTAAAATASDSAAGASGAAAAATAGTSTTADSSKSSSQPTPPPSSSHAPSSATQHRVAQQPNRGGGGGGSHHHHSSSSQHHHQMSPHSHMNRNSSSRMSNNSHASEGGGGGGMGYSHHGSHQKPPYNQHHHNYRQSSRYYTSSRYHGGYNRNRELNFSDNG